MASWVVGGVASWVVGGVASWVVGGVASCALNLVWFFEEMVSNSAALSLRPRPPYPSPPPWIT